MFLNTSLALLRAPVSQCSSVLIPFRVFFTSTSTGRRPLCDSQRPTVSDRDGSLDGGLLRPAVRRLTRHPSRFCWAARGGVVVRCGLGVYSRRDLLSRGWVKRVDGMDAIGLGERQGRCNNFFLLMLLLMLLMLLRLLLRLFCPCCCRRCRCGSLFPALNVVASSFPASVGPP